MIVADLDVIRIAIDKAKADAPLRIDRDRVLAPTVIRERMEAIFRRHLQVLQVGRQIDVLQLAGSAARDVGRKAPRCPGREQIASAPVRERFDHRSTVTRHVTRVNALTSRLLGLFTLPGGVRAVATASGEGQAYDRTCQPSLIPCSNPRNDSSQPGLEVAAVEQRTPPSVEARQVPVRHLS